jgi:hypothetical protein
LTGFSYQPTKIVLRRPLESAQGAAILSASGQAAEKWADIATYPSTAKDVAGQVGLMQAGASFGPIVLANRYDGIDLAGNACRFLVMDNLPQGTSDYDLYRMNVVADSAVSSLLAQRIEQGIGRGTRGGGDYCAIVLVGSKLVGWIGRKALVRTGLTPHNFPADCSDDRADECSTWTNSSKAAISIAK